MYHGSDVSVYVDAKNAPNYKRSDQMAADITLGGIRFLTTDYTTDWSMPKNSLYGLRGIVRTKHRTNNIELDVWFRGAGYALRNEESSTTCNWDGTDCYWGRIYPSMDSLSASAGSSIGGQELVITGNSFDKAKTVEVLVDDVPCDISDVTVDTITCITGPKTLGAPQISYAGEHGLYRTLVNENPGANASNYDTLSNERILLTSAEVADSPNTVNAFSMIQGFYEAPVDGLYQFHQSCDDTCSLWLSMEDPADPLVDPMDPAIK